MSFSSPLNWRLFDFLGKIIIERPAGIKMSDSKNDNQLDVVVIGAGFAGMYMLHKLRATGLKIIVLEALSLIHI